MCFWAADTLSPHAEFTIYIMSHSDRPESFSHILDLVWHEWATQKQTTDEQRTEKNPWLLMMMSRSIPTIFWLKSSDNLV